MGLMAKRPQRADARRNRERIVAAARDVFAREGVQAQMDAVAAAAGVGVGTVYRHFPTKEALMGALVAARFEQFAQFAREAQEAEDPWEGFASFVRRAAGHMQDDAGTRECLTSATPDIWVHVREAQAALREALGPVIDRAHAAGVLRRDFSLDDMPTMMCGLSATMGAHPGAPMDWRRGMEFALDGLRVRQPAEQRG